MVWGREVLKKYSRHNLMQERGGGGLVHVQERARNRHVVYEVVYILK